MIVYLLDSPYACGAVWVQDGIIRKAAPIYRRLIGQRLEQVLRAKGYSAVELRP